MVHLNRFSKIFLALVMLALPLVTPLATTASEVNEDQSYEDFADWDFDDDFVLEDDSVFDLEPVIFFDVASDELHPAIEGYVPEMLFADDMLLDVEESEIFLPIEPRTIPAIGSGVVQFVLEPVNWNTNWGTLAEARAAAMNSMAVYHRLYANGTTTSMATAVNGAFGRDAIYLGQSANGNRLRVMIGAFEGYVHVWDSSVILLFLLME